MKIYDDSLDLINDIVPFLSSVDKGLDDKGYPLFESKYFNIYIYICNK